MFHHRDDRIRTCVPPEPRAPGLHGESLRQRWFAAQQPETLHGKRAFAAPVGATLATSGPEHYIHSRVHQCVPNRCLIDAETTAPTCTSICERTVESERKSELMLTCWGGPACGEVRPRLGHALTSSDAPGPVPDLLRYVAEWDPAQQRMVVCTHRYVASPWPLPTEAWQGSATWRYVGYVVETR
jgi:hypothetical protein